MSLTEGLGGAPVDRQQQEKILDWSSSWQQKLHETLPGGSLDLLQNSWNFVKPV